MTTPAAKHTASEIAQALGVTPQAIRSRLQGVTPDGKTCVRGMVADAWSYHVLPVALQIQLSSCAEVKGYRSAADLLSAPGAAWQPAVSLAEADSASLGKAAKLQRALRPLLEKSNDTSLEAAQFEDLGVAEYESVFGHKISRRHWRRVFNRIIQRDLGAGAWERLELYLDDKPAAKAPVSVSPTDELADREEFNDLARIIASDANPAQPGEATESLIWLWAFETFEQLASDGTPDKKNREQLFRHLWRRAPFLAANAKALRSAFNRKYERWLESGRDVKALADLRSQKSGWHRAPKIPVEVRDALVAKAVLGCGGRVSQAWREMKSEGGLSEDMASHYLDNPASKSHVPGIIREAVKYEVKLLEDMHHGPRQAALNGAYISRNWDDVHSMDWFQADDVTWPVYYYVPDGKGWFSLMRGQCLLMIDLRSLKVITYAQQHERNYNARVIRTLITKTCDEHGLPRKGFYFERGIWKDSRILAGDPKADPMDWNSVELGLREFGLKFIHANQPRAKPIERVIGLLQNQMEGDPCYCGRDERHDAFERFQKQKLLVESRKLHPSEAFYSAAQWLARLDELCERHNSTPQEGKMTQGYSPDEAFQMFRNPSDPPVKFDASCRYLLAHHKQPVRVGRNGITLRFGKHVFNYRGAETGPLIGQTVLAWFNPECPEFLSVTDMNRKNPFSVARSAEVPAIDGGEILKQELKSIAEHQSYSKVRYSILRSKHQQTFRPNIVDPATAELGRQMAAQRGELESQQEQTVDRRGRRVAEGRRLETDILARIREKEQQST